ncbi:MAG TPA: arginase family protein [Chryseolinea sp.]|jgi:arginase|nr:arginase family protein [Chryseolinea sp.]
MKIFLLAVPYDSGHYKIRLGTGPLMLQKGLARDLNNRMHEVREGEVSLDIAFPTEIATGFEVARRVAARIFESKEHNEFPIVFAGNCNAAALGILSGLRGEEGIVWFDAHGDFNTPETSSSGFLDGMALSMVTGSCWTALTASIPGYRPMPEEKIVLIGGHDLDPLEENRLRASAITVISPETVRRNSDVSTFLPTVRSVYLHIDLDVLDTSFVKANSYAGPGGLSPAELFSIISVIKKNHNISAIAFTSYDPSMDPEQKVQGVITEIVKIVIE